MNLIRFTKNPIFPSLMDGFLSNEWISNKNDMPFTLPAVNVQEDNKQFLLELAIPGKSKDDFEIDVDNDVLMIGLSDSEQKTENEEGYTHREFHFSAFKKSFRLPKSIDSSKIKANYNDGILAIEIPKRTEAQLQKTKRIAIE